MKETKLTSMQKNDTQPFSFPNHGVDCATKYMYSQEMAVELLSGKIYYEYFPMKTCEQMT